MHMKEQNLINFCCQNAWKNIVLSAVSNSTLVRGEVNFDYIQLEFPCGQEELCEGFSPLLLIMQLKTVNVNA